MSRAIADILETSLDSLAEGAQKEARRHIFAGRQVFAVRNGDLVADLTGPLGGIATRPVKAERAVVRLKNGGGLARALDRKPSAPHKQPPRNISASIKD